MHLKDAPVAARCLVTHRDTLEIPWASSLRRVNGIGVNMLLYWSVLEFACSRAATVFDFGRSTLDSGTYRFKQQWGAEPQQLHWHYWLNERRRAAAPEPVQSEVPAGRGGVAAAAAARWRTGSGRIWCKNLP